MEKEIDLRIHWKERTTFDNLTWVKTEAWISLGGSDKPCRCQGNGQEEGGMVKKTEVQRRWGEL